MINPQVQELLAYVTESMRIAEYYSELMEAYCPQSSDPIDYENYFNTIDRIWNQLDESREMGEDGLEDNDEILDAWEYAHKLACEVMHQIQTQKHNQL